MVVVDCGFSLEDDEELSYDTLAPRRNGATLTTLALADEVVVVGGCDPVGLQRLVRGLQELGTVQAPPPTVCVNRVRSGAVGANPEQRVSEALARFAGVTEALRARRPGGPRHGAPRGARLVECARPARRCGRRCARSPRRLSALRSGEVGAAAEVAGQPLNSSDNPPTV